jgi:large subunit ribosomal protein L30
MAIKPKLRIKQLRSGVSRTKSIQATLRGLGLRGPHTESVLENTPSIRGAVKKVIHLVAVEEIDG